MAKNTKQTSPDIAALAAKVVKDKSSSQIAKRLAASALAQSNNEKQTGSELEDLASGVLRSNKYSAQTKKLAGSVLSQSNRGR